MSTDWTDGTERPLWNPGPGTGLVAMLAVMGMLLALVQCGPKNPDSADWRLPPSPSGGP